MKTILMKSKFQHALGCYSISLVLNLVKFLLMAGVNGLLLMKKTIRRICREVSVCERWTGPFSNLTE
jgi:hypothetical protein